MKMMMEENVVYFNVEENSATNIKIFGGAGWELGADGGERRGRMADAGEEGIDHQPGGGPQDCQGDGDEVCPHGPLERVCHATGDQEEVLLTELHPRRGPDDLPVLHLPEEA